MKRLLIILLILTTINCFSQELEIATLDKSQITTTLLDSSSTTKMLTQYNGKQNNSLHKKWTARTYQLSNGKILIEFYDKQSVLVDNLEQFKKLDRIRFVKNTIDFLRKNISYKIELTFDEGIQIIEKEKPSRLSQYKSESPLWNDFEVFQLKTEQILFLDKSEKFNAATIFPDIKTLASENTSVLETAYGYEDEEHLMKILASGDRLLDYDDEHLIYPKYLKNIIKNHKLTLIEQKIYVSEFFGNLYKSESGYYVLMDEVNQKNGSGNKKLILSLRIYNTLEEVREAENKFAEFKDEGFTSEHFYQKISDKYGQKFSDFVPHLIDQLPTILNFDKDQISFDSTGMDLVDEALKWNGTNLKLFDSWFPSVLAFYGQCYIMVKKDGVWVTTYENEDKVWIPEVKLSDGSSAWDWRELYKSLYEGPIPIRWAGDWYRK